MKLVQKAAVTLDGKQAKLFDGRPIELAGFRLRASGVDPVGKPTINQWRNAMEFAEAAEESSPYWVGDLALYADGRPEWRSRLDDTTSRLHVARQTVANLKSISKRVKEPARKLAPTLSHAAVVAPLPAPQQEHWLGRATSENWTARELGNAIRANGRTKIAEGQSAEMHSIEVIVCIDVEAISPYAAEQAAWSWVKQAVKGLPSTKVIAAHARAR